MASGRTKIYSFGLRGDSCQYLIRTTIVLIMKSRMVMTQLSCGNVRARHNSISKDSNYTTSPLKPIIVLKGLYG